MRVPSIWVLGFFARPRGWIANYIWVPPRWLVRDFANEMRSLWRERDQSVNVLETRPGAPVDVAINDADDDDEDDVDDNRDRAQS